ncbi:hypothetical protein BJI67_16480 (plasmid) [Acidihalobacter aeolianus]|uniref:Uncharacterized protein n=1 Tax=Acidihalobacter aeolianus TaxID=2792603 RepID=A0A1D8KD21_9GAMM|nr:hypothetical protein [Acidihalobacter aeolianus]AOV18834.1 hypothetical protein BJI67_16480 [Acidihalobacter aeolianus]
MSFVTRDVDFSTLVYTIDQGRVVEHRLKTLCEQYADKVSTSGGTVTALHTRGNELWQWDSRGRQALRVRGFDTAGQAEEARMLALLDNLLSGGRHQPRVYIDRGHAETAFYDERY